MSVQPVELSKAYRLLQVGSTTMISAKYNGVENVMRQPPGLGWQASEKWWPISAPRPSLVSWWKRAAISWCRSP